MDESHKREKTYKPPISNMPNAIWIIGFVVFIFAVFVNQGRIEVDGLVAYGGWFWFAMLMAFKIAPMKIGLDSKKCMSFRIGSTLYESAPIGKIPAMDGYPRMYVYPVGSVKAWHFYDVMLTTKSVMVIPERLALTMNWQVMFNVWHSTYLDHEELPPHILKWLREDMQKLRYDEKMPVEFGLRAYWVRDMTPQAVEERDELLLAAGYTRADIKRLEPTLEYWASMATVFEKGDQVKDDEDNELRLRRLGKKYASLENDYNQLMTRHTNIMKIVQFQERAPPEKASLVGTLLPGSGQQPPPQQGGRYPPPQ